MLTARKRLAVLDSSACKTQQIALVVLLQIGVHGHVRAQGPSNPSKSRLSRQQPCAPFAETRSSLRFGSRGTDGR